MVERGLARARSQRARATGHREQLRLRPVRGLAAEALEPLERAVENWLDATDCSTRRGKPNRYHPAWPAIHVLGARSSAAIAIQTCFNGLALSNKRSSIASQIGADVDQELRLRTLRGTAFGDWQELTLRTRRVGRRSTAELVARACDRHDVAAHYLDRFARMNVGMVLLYLLVGATGLFRFERTSFRGRSLIRVVPHEETLAWFERVMERDAIRHPAYSALPEPPRRWDRHLEGGGFEIKELQRPLVREMQGVGAQQRECAPLAAAINLLQETPWRVNPWVYRVACEAWTRGLECAAMPRPERLPKPARPEEGASEADWKAWKAALAQLFAFDEVRLRRRMHAAHLIDGLRAHAEMPVFHHAHVADFRGRVRAASVQVSWQSEDLTRGCLEFGEPVAWTRAPRAARWLARRIAALWGPPSLDSYELREAWVRAHREEILGAARDPFGTWGWWQSAKHPWQFLAACKAWEALATGQGDAHLRIPVSIDASNNALQVYSMLAGDEALALATNVLPTDPPRDSYTELGALAATKLEEEGGRYAHDWLRLWKGKPAPRGAVKPACMALMFGAGPTTTTRAVMEWYMEEPIQWFGRGAFEHCRALSLAIRRAVHDLGKGAAAIQGWAADCARQLCSAGLPVSWTSPSGFRVVTAHRQKTETTVRLSLGLGFAASQRFPLLTGRPNARAAARALAPNLVQSCDAAVLHRALETMGSAGLRLAGTAHDAYAVPAEHVEDVHAILRATNVSIFTPDLLTRLHLELSATLGQGLPPPPARGPLEIARVADSAYLYR